MGYRIIKVNSNGANQPADLTILPGEFEGSRAATEAITESGDYFLIKTFNVKDNGTNSTAVDSSTSEKATETTQNNDLENSTGQSQQAVPGGVAGQTQKGSDEKSSSKKDSTKKDGTKKESAKGGNGKSSATATGKQTGSSSNKTR